LKDKLARFEYVDLQLEARISVVQLLDEISVIEKNNEVKIHAKNNTLRVVGKIKSRSAHKAKVELIKIIQTKFKEEDAEFAYDIDYKSKPPSLFKSIMTSNINVLQRILDIKS
jgi:cytochrome c-type biogenesis protein CcmE